MSDPLKKVLDPAGLIFKEPPPIIPAPAVSSGINTPPTMPTPDDKAVEDARRRSLQATYARRGRSSTILSDALGGSPEALGG